MNTIARSELQSVMDDIAADIGNGDVKLLEVRKISESGELGVSDWCIFTENVSFSKMYGHTWGRAYVLVEILEQDKDDTNVYHSSYYLRSRMMFNEAHAEILGFVISSRHYDENEKLKIEFYSRKTEEDETNTIISNKAIMSHPDWSYGRSIIDLLVPDNGKLTIRSYEGYAVTPIMMDNITNEGWTTLIPEAFNKIYTTRAYAKSHGGNDVFASSYSTYMTLDTMEHYDDEIASLGNEIHGCIVNNDGYYIDPDDTVMEIISDDCTLFIIAAEDIPVGYPILSICSLSEDDKD